MRTALVAALLIACSSPPVVTSDAWNEPRDGGPPQDAESRRCDADCRPTICIGGNAASCEPTPGTSGDAAFCDGCFPQCPDPTTQSLMCTFNAWECYLDDGTIVHADPTCVTR